MVNSKREIEREESPIIREVAEAMLADSRTKDMNILVRPHPLNLGYLPKFLETKPRNVFVYPINGEIPDTDEKIKRYNSSIYYAVAVMGINTTAYLEVAALDRPCITLYFKEFAETQLLPHFHHLEDAGFLESARDTSEMIALLQRILDGADDLATQRDELVKNFLKPMGSEKPSVEYVVDLIEEIGSRK